MAKLPELEQRAARLGVGKQVGHQPMTPEQIARVVKAGGELAGVAGVPGGVTSAVNRAVDAAAHTASAVQQSRATQLDRNSYDDHIGRLAHRLHVEGCTVARSGWANWTSTHPRTGWPLPRVASWVRDANDFIRHGGSDRSVG